MVSVLRSRILLPAGVLLVVGALAGLLIYLKNARPTPGRVASSQAAAGAKEITLAATIQAVSVVAVPATMDGVLDYVGASLGDQVTEGQLLAQIRNESLAREVRDAEAALARQNEKVNMLEAALSAARLEENRALADAARAQGEFEKAKRESDRQQLLLSEGATPKRTADRALEEMQYAEKAFESARLLAEAAQQRAGTLRRQYESARSALQRQEEELEQVRAGLEHADVYSPVNGVLASARFRQGENVSVEVNDLFTIAVDTSKLIAVATAPPGVTERLRPGQAVSVLPDEAAQAIEGRLREVKDNQVVVEFTNPSGAVRPGQSAQLRIKLT